MTNRLIRIEELLTTFIEKTDKRLQTIETGIVDINKSIDKLTDSVVKLQIYNKKRRRFSRITR
jgi:hypothetical protein